MTLLPSVAVVILNWNGKHFLEKFLPSVLASDYENLSVVIADNASTDGSISFLRENFPGVKILLNEINEGFAKGYNTALKQVSADYYVLLNSDVEVTAGWIKPVIALMENHTKVAACQPKILSFNNKSQFEYAGAAGGWIDALGYPFGRGRIFEHCEPDRGQYNTTSEIFWATGAALFVRAAVFHELHGFDEYFFAHQEEIDLCWRMQRKGYTIFAECSSVVYHVGGGTLPTGNTKKVYLNFRNNLVMLSKNLPISSSLWKIPVRIILDMIVAFQALIKGNLKMFISIESAHLHFFKWLLGRKTATRLPSVKMKSLAGVYHGSIVWQYFIKNKKTFFEIINSKK